MFTSEVNATGFKELGNRLDWFSKFRIFCCSYDMAFKASSVVLFLDIEAKEIPKLDSISVSF